MTGFGRTDGRLELRHAVKCGAVDAMLAAVVVTDASSASRCVPDRPTTSQSNCKSNSASPVSRDIHTHSQKRSSVLLRGNVNNRVSVKLLPKFLAFCSAEYFIHRFVVLNTSDKIGCNVISKETVFPKRFLSQMRFCELPSFIVLFTLFNCGFRYDCQ